MIYKYVFWLAVLSLIVFLLERIRPWREQSVNRPLLLQDMFWLIFNGYLLGIIFAPIFKFIDSSMAKGFFTVSGNILKEIRFLSKTGLEIQIIIILIIGDFIEWIVHNLLHRVPFLWKLHRIHHSIHTMDWIGNFRFHWTEPLIYHSFRIIPMTILGASWQAILFVSVFATLIGFLNHSNLNISWGPLKYIFNSPRMHIWHHDVKMHKQSGQNFGIVFSLWDWIFRTAYMPDGQPEKLGYYGDEKLSDNLLKRFFLPFLD